MSKLSKRSEEHEEEVGEGWLLPYADLLTLLLALFIVLFASSQVDQQKFKAMANAFTNAINGGAAFEENGNFTDLDELPMPPLIPADDNAYTNVGGNELLALQALQNQLEKFFEENGLTGSVTTNIDERGLVISLRNAVLFDSGKADIKKDYENALVSIAGAIDKLENYVRVEGHTDNVPMGQSDQFPTNWELSTARACSVVRLFISDGGMNPDKLVSCGYGEYRPVADNATAEGRAQNRRIDIIVLKSKYSSLEQQLAGGSE